MYVLENSDDTHNTAVSKIMMRNRFEKILSLFHTADNDNLPLNNKFGKVRPLFTELNKRFLKAFFYQKTLAIDESMIPYFGRHSTKQFIRGKPIRFGYKIWSMITLFGYSVQLEPYQRAGVTNLLFGLGGSVENHWVGTLPRDKYFLYFDNFFTSLPLLQHLKANNIFASGALRANRTENCPLTAVDQMKKTSCGCHDFKMNKKSDIVVVRWNENSVVTLTSTCHGVSPVGTASRWSRAKKQ